MALYEVIRTDDVKAGEFVSGYVLASGTAQARSLVAHLEGVTKSNTFAARVETNKVQKMLSAYFDESLPEADPLGDDLIIPGFTL